MLTKFTLLNIGLTLEQLNVRFKLINSKENNPVNRGKKWILAPNLELFNRVEHFGIQ